ncbi:MAG: hypothetical protein EOO75_14295 [Myxococcales bacterium]|nr:MAG: hypothetical protein EOO75_14295 [Myxococcales bacterium]
MISTPAWKTLLPVDLVSSVFHAGVEIKILSDLTLVSQVGLGRVKHRYFDDKLNELSSERRTYLSLDLQARYYAVGQIGTGIYLSADTSYTWLNSDQFVKSPLMDLSSGMRVGGSFGGAYTSFFGLGVDMQFLIHGRVYTPSFAETSPSELRPGPLAFGASIALTYVF